MLLHAALGCGQVPIYKPGLGRDDLAQPRLRVDALYNRRARLRHRTASARDGQGSETDVHPAVAASREIGRHIGGYREPVDKTTVPVGTMVRV